MSVTDPASRAVPASGDLHRALHVFIHDLRTPVSVALGYLRLVREQRLSDPDMQARALQQSMESVARLSTLCEEASEYLTVHEATVADTPRCPAAQLAEAIAARASAAGLTAEIANAPTGTWTTSASSSDAMAERVAAVVALTRHDAAEAPAGLAISWVDGQMRTTAGTAAQRAALESAPGHPVDPWRNGQGLRLALACLDIERHGGRVWTTDDAWPAVAIDLPISAEAA
ncbi:MAG: hypothetical protein R2712_07310 [Vicinamibacterales bacterium]